MQVNQATLDQLMPAIVQWAEQQQQIVLASRVLLHPDHQRLARSVGVARPENIRVRIVSSIPMPTDPLLREAAKAAGYAAGAVGMTIGYAVFIRSGFAESQRILSHEFRHVYQFEQMGCSLPRVLAAHLRDVMIHGYNAPHEVDARAHEIDG